MNRLDGYITLPASGEGPGVVVLHEAWGLTTGMAWAADRLAAAGFVTFVPDLADSMHGVLGAISQLRSGHGPLLDAARTAVDCTLERPEVATRALGVVGFSMGSALALSLGDHPGIRALGLNYGMVPSMDRVSVEVPVVASFGGRDRLLPRKDRPLRRLLGSGGGGHDVEVYPEAGHSFMTPDDPTRLRIARSALGLRYHEAAAAHAWDRLLAMLQDQLGSDSTPSRSSRPGLIVPDRP